jgi:hypothetical protein
MMDFFGWLFDRSIALAIGFCFGMFSAALLSANAEPQEGGDEHPGA